MKRLNNEELKQIEGGGIKIGLVLGIGAIITFLIGVADGYMRPLKCN